MMRASQQRWSPLICVLAHAVAVGALTSCTSPEAPTEARARTAAREREAKLQRVEQLVRATASTHFAGGQMDDVLDTTARATAAVSSLEPALAALVDDIGAVGAEVRLHVPPDVPGRSFTGRALVHNCGLEPHANRDGSKTPIAVDGRELYRGLYQTARTVGGVSHGDGAYHPGIHVRWVASAPPITVSIAVCFLLDGTPRPK